MDDIKSKLLIAEKNYEEIELKLKVRERIELLETMKNYEIPFTITVEDIKGNSIILPAKADKLTTELLG